MSVEAKHILCIDDDPDMIELFKIILLKNNFKVTGAPGGAEGLRKIHEISPDLVLLDLMMADMGGWEVYQQMKADDKTKNIPVIIVTAKAQNIDKVLGLHIARADDYIAKPFSPTELVESIHKVIEKHNPA